ncbi:adenylate/guanylate cyclase domain-containing protein [Rhizobiales bacterium]|uniref:adenylate/guanylate cyclase domain-containing protein n=1 Tax=Hongsoonwoonella zoysiae TaxID=2821844 RepID=UPI001560E480|nr:adenylate/guanylate cyclase domain-containing protein [Hongsoonwoonella zoysiae]NRG16291.1 adenylate/guanylate cyclase domain-containing protein [Hongsoonwoonella zoysiae]
MNVPGEVNVKRKLAAIVAADVVGYSAMMAEDEPGTLAALRRHRKETFEPIVASHDGRIVKLMGDGALVEFPSVVEAVEAALAIQEAMAAGDRVIRLRIGVNLGDVIVEDEDIYGDGVNVAARLEKLADPGGICISSIVHESLGNRADATFAYTGSHEVKGIPQPIRVWRWPAADTGQRPSTPLSLPDKPSIAVLPFDNLSGDPEQEYFADGMVEEIITALSRINWLFVIARNSTFTYKGRAVNVREVGRELGVRYVLEGSVRKAGDRVRICGQLIDAASGVHLWADRFDGSLENVFDLQDNVTSNVVGALSPRLERAEIERAKRKPTESLDAYDYYLRGLSAVHQWTKEANEEALACFSKAVDIDPDFASAYGMAARCYSMRKASGWMKDRERETAEAVRLARRAAALGRDDAVALCTAGIALAFVAGELEDGAALIDQSLALDPNLAWAWLFRGWAYVWGGNPEPALECFENATRLSPHDPHGFAMYSATSMAHFFTGRYADALAWAQKAIRVNAHLLLACCTAAASAALLGEDDTAAEAMENLRKCDPDLRLSNLRDLLPIRDIENFSRWKDGMRRAGLPE